MTMWGGGFDPDLGSKIDQMLAGKASAKQRVEEFLVDELHVDPSKIPLSYKDAKVLINTKMSERDAGSARIQGNSMGLAYVEFFKQDQDQPDTCPNCSATSMGGAYFYQSGTTWMCDDCEQSFSWSRPVAGGTKVTERTDKALWLDLLRIYTSFCRHYQHEAEPEKLDAPSRPRENFTKFDVTHTWQEASVTGVPDPKPRWKRPEKYPTGTRLRVTDGTETIYVRIGGLFSDTEVVNLASMKPIEKISAWNVVEVLDDEATG